MKLKSATARNALCLLIATIGLTQSAQAMTCGEFLGRAQSTVSKKVLTPILNAVSLPRQLTARRLNKKLNGRTYESFFSEDGSRLDLSNLNLNIDDVNYLYEQIKNKGLITAKLKVVKLSYNPEIKALGLVSIFKDISHFTQLTEIDLRDVYVSSLALEYISNYYPDLQKLRLSVFNGRSLRALHNNYKLELLDLSEAYIRESEVSVPKNEDLRRPSVSIGDLKLVIKRNGRSLNRILLPPVLPRKHENIFELAKSLKVDLVHVPSHLAVSFEGAERFNNKGGLLLNVKGEPTHIYFPSFTFPRNGENADMNEIVVAHHINLFLKNLSEEGVKGQLISPMKTIEGTYYGDIYFKRIVNGKAVGFLLSNLLSQMRLIAPTTKAWNNHNVADPATWKRLIDLHDELINRGALSSIGPIK
jgi:hypothetical protein